MSDKLTPAQRHKCMSHIRGKNTKPEILVRSMLHAHGYRFRLQEKRLPGTPDIVLKRLHTVILVNGCFWHGHMIAADGENVDLPCRYFVLPKSNSEFWASKIKRNQERDLENRKALTSLGWNVIQIWECELKPAVRQNTLQRLLYTLSQIELQLNGSRIKSYVLEGEEPQRMVADESGNV